MADETVGLELGVEGADEFKEAAKTVEDLGKRFEDVAKAIEELKDKQKDLAASVKSTKDEVQGVVHKLKEFADQAKSASGELSSIVGKIGSGSVTQTLGGVEGLMNFGAKFGGVIAAVGAAAYVLPKLYEFADGIGAIDKSLEALGTSKKHLLEMFEKTKDASGFNQWMVWAQQGGFKQNMGPIQAAPVDVKGFTDYSKLPDYETRQRMTAAGGAIDDLGGIVAKQLLKSLLGKMTEEQAAAQQQNGVSVLDMKKAQVKELMENAQKGDVSAIESLRRRSPAFDARMDEMQDEQKANEQERHRGRLRQKYEMPRIGDELSEFLSDDDRNRLKALYEEYIEAMRKNGEASKEGFAAQRELNKAIQGYQKALEEDKALDEQQRKFQESNEKAERYRNSPKAAWEEAKNLAKKAGIDLGSTAQVDALLKGAPGGDSTLLSGDDQAYIRRRANMAKNAAKYQSAMQQYQQAAEEYMSAGNPRMKRFLRDQHAREARVMRNSRFANIAARQQYLRDAGGKKAIGEREKAAEKMERAGMLMQESMEQLRRDGMRIYL